MKINLQYFPQHTATSCGPACLRMVFSHLGIQYSEEKLIRLCKTTANGTSHEHLLDEIKREGLSFEAKSHGTIKQLVMYIDNGYPVIINYCEPFSDEGHYAVVSGYDAKEELLILADPCNGNDFCIFWDEFISRWHNENNSSKGWYVVVGREGIVVKQSENTN